MGTLFTEKRVYRFLAGASVVMLISGWSLGYSGESQSLSRNSVATSKVIVGDFSIKIDGYGSLQSMNKRVLTAANRGVVDEIKLKAGASVDVDTVILTLKNPELESQLRQSLAALKNAKTLKRQLILQQQREILDLETSLSELESEAEIAMLQVDAERSLAKSGIVSGVHAKKNELTAKQLVKRVQLEKNKRTKLLAMQIEALSIQDDLISQSQEEFNVTKLMVEQLSVTAGIEGVIQRLPLNLGQSVDVGTELALIGSLSPLMAEINVPQMQAHMVSEGMDAEIRSINGTIVGKVIRVDPVVNEGAVQVDIKLSRSDGVKPMQLVDAVLFAQVRENVHYIDKPAFAKENSSMNLFKLLDDNRGTMVSVQLGRVSDRRIEVISGLNAGDEVIISEHDISDDIKQIKLIN